MSKKKRQDNGGIYWEKEEIRKMLAISDIWLIHGLIAIYRYQSGNEKLQKNTNLENNVGFSKVDATWLSTLAEFYMANGFLSPKQIESARKGMMKYAGQLMRIANGEQ